MGLSKNWEERLRLRVKQERVQLLLSNCPWKKGNNDKEEDHD
jgi:hypothetical protein